MIVVLKLRILLWNNYSDRFLYLCLYTYILAVHMYMKKRSDLNNTSKFVLDQVICRVDPIYSVSIVDPIYLMSIKMDIPI